jgi:hypothetical protein
MQVEYIYKPKLDQKHNEFDDLYGWAIMGITNIGIYIYIYIYIYR